MLSVACCCAVLREREAPLPFAERVGLRPGLRGVVEVARRVGLLPGERGVVVVARVGLLPGERGAVVVARLFV